MNHAFKSIWNEKTKTFVAVAEKTASKGKAASSGASLTTGLRKALGNIILTAGLSSIAVAVQAATGVGGGVAIGTSNNCNPAASAGKNESVAVGCGSVADEARDSNTTFYDRGNPYHNASANIGTLDTAGYYRSTAVGTEAKAYNGGTALGMKAESAALGVALGAQAKSEDVAAIAVGPAALAKGNTSLAIGRQSIAGEDFAQAIGNVSAATGKGSLAMGHSATAAGNRSIAIGSADIDNAGNTGDQQGTVYQTQEQTLSTGKDSIAFGAAAKATADHTLAIGAHSHAEGINALALGAHSKADKDRSIAVGVGAQANFIDSVALGSNSEVSHDNSVAIGTRSKTNAYDQEAFLVGGVATGAVAVGSVGDERRLQNVAAGALDTDGVNVSQLKQHKTITDKTGGDVANHLGGGSTFNSETGQVTNPTYNIGGEDYLNVESALKASRTEVTAGTNVGVVEASGVDGQAIYKVNADGTLVSVGSDALTVVGTKDDSTNITDYAVDLSQKTKDSLENADSALQTIVTQVDGTDVKTLNKDDNNANFVSGTNIQLSDDGSGGIKVATKDDVVFENTTINNDLSVGGVTKLGDNFTVNRDNSVKYTGPITEGDHITNKTYVDGGRTVVAVGTNIAGIDAVTDPASGQTTYAVNADGASASAGSDAVKVVAGTKDPVTNVTDYAVDLSDKTKESLEDADSALQTVVTQVDGKDVKTLTKDNNNANFVSGTNIQLSDDGNGGIEVATKDDVTFENTTVNNNLTVGGETKLGDHFTVKNDNSVHYSGPISEGDHITNKTYVDNSVTELGNKGFNIAADNGDDDNVKLGETVTYTSDDKSIITTVSADNEIDFALGTDLTVGGPGKDGEDGVDGKLAVNGKDGKTGVAIDGADGSIGLTGPAGADGIPTLTMRPEIKPGDVINNDNLVTRLTYKDKDGTSHTVATLENDGLRFLGNDNIDTIDGYVTRNLNKVMQIVGSGADKNADDEVIAYSSGNVRTVATQDRGIEIQFADTPNFQGADMGGKQITNVGSGRTDTDGNAVDNIADANPDNAANIGDIQDISNAGSGGGFGLADPAGNDVRKNLGQTIKVFDPDNNILTTADNDKGELQLSLSNDLSVGGPGEPGKDGVDGKIAVNGKDGVSGVTINGEDGSIGLTGPAGADGTPGASGTITVVDGVPGVDGPDGITRIVIDDVEVATMKDGLKFAGNTGDTIAKQLNETLSIEGELDETKDVSGANLRVDSDGDKLNLVMAQDLTDLNSITIGDDITNQTIINKGNVTTNNLTVTGDTKLGDNFYVDNSGAHYGGDITENTHIVNKEYVDQAGTDLTQKGLKFAGNDGEVLHRDLGSQLNVVGGMTDMDQDAASATNIRTVANNNGDLEIQLSKNLTDLESVTVGSGDKKVEIREDSLVLMDAGNTNTSTAMGTTIADKDGNTNAMTAAGMVVTDVDTGASTDVGAGIITVAGGSNSIQIDGTAGTISGLSNQTTDYAGFADGSGRAATEEQLKDSSTGLVEKGLKFAGNDGVEIHRDLGSQLNVVGGMTDMGQDAASATNLRTVANNNGDLEIQLSKNLTDLESVTIDSDDIQTVIDEDGVTVADKAGNITNVAATQVTVGGDNPIVMNGNAGMITGLTNQNWSSPSFADGSGRAATEEQLKPLGDFLGFKDGDYTFNYNGKDHDSLAGALDSIHWNVEAPEAGDNTGGSGTGGSSGSGGSTGGSGNVTTTPISNTNTIGFAGDENISVSKTERKDAAGKVVGADIQVALEQDIKVNSITAVDVNATNVNTGSVNINNGGPVINSDGIDMSDKRITNVAAGVDAGDAVNVGQLEGVQNNIRNEIGGVRRDLHKVDRKLRAGVAAAMATAGLPQAYLPGKSMVGLAGGTWNGESGVALGVSKITDNGKWVFKVSGNASTRGDYGGTVGGGYQW